MIFERFRFLIIVLVILVSAQVFAGKRIVCESTLDGTDAALVRSVYRSALQVGDPVVYMAPANWAHFRRRPIEGRVNRILDNGQIDFLSNGNDRILRTVEAFEVVSQLSAEETYDGLKIGDVVKRKNKFWGRRIDIFFRPVTVTAIYGDGTVFVEDRDGNREWGPRDAYRIVE